MRLTRAHHRANSGQAQPAALDTAADKPRIRSAPQMPWFPLLHDEQKLSA